MKYIEGEYVNFLDSDDTWNLDVFERVYNFFEQHNNINVVGCRVKFFEAREGYHILDYKFKETKIVNVLEDYNYLQLSMCFSFVRAEVLKDYRFDERLNYNEDSKLIISLMLDTGLKYGIIKEAIYNYRKRNANTSALQTKTQTLNWYFDVPELVYKYLINKSIENYGVVILYVQYYIMYDCQWRIKGELPEILNEKEQVEKYKNIIKTYLQYIDDNIIVEQRNLYTEYKLYTLSLKYGRNIAKELKWKKDGMYFNNLNVYKIKNKSLLKIKFIDIDEDYLNIEGEINCAIPKEDYEIYAITKDEKAYDLEYLEDENNNREAFGEVFLKNRRFIIKVPIKDLKELRIMIKYKNIYDKRLNLIFEKFTGLDKEKSYKISGEYIIRSAKNKIIIRKNTKK